MTETIEVPKNCGVIIVKPKNSDSAKDVSEVDNLTSNIVKNIGDNYQGGHTIYRL